MPTPTRRTRVLPRRLPLPDRTPSRRLHEPRLRPSVAALAAAAALAGAWLPTGASAQGTAFTYQGHLNQGAAPAAGSYDLQFSLFGAANAGSALTAPVTKTATVVSNGFFSAVLDFGPGAFNGADRWLEIAARTNGNGAFTTLAPRQPVSAVPYALYAPVAGSATSVSAANLTGKLSLGQLPSALVTNGAAGVTLNGTFRGNGSGLTGVALLAGGNTLSGNQSILAGQLGIGTTQPAGDVEVVSDSTASILATAHGSLGQFVGRSAGGIPGAESAITAGTELALFGGRGHTGTRFSSSRAAMILAASEDWSDAATGADIAFGTTANGSTSRTERMRLSNGGNLGIGTAAPQARLQLDSTVQYSERLRLSGQEYYGAGWNSPDGISLLLGVNRPGNRQLWIGDSARLTPDRNTSVIRLFPGFGGSLIDTIGTDGATQQPLALGPYGLLTVSTNGGVGIGTVDDYRGYASRVLAIRGDELAPRYAGTSALVLTNPVNSTAWSIATYTTGDLVLAETGAAAAHVRVQGELVADAVTVNNALWANGEVTCTALNITSDLNAKEGFRPVDAREVLDKVARLPISEWQYKSQADVRHIGPMAQDFRAAFAVGRDERHITSVDADGVALAAIQGLNAKLEERLEEKQAEIGRLQSENQTLAARLAAIERALGLGNANGAAAPRQ